MSDVTTYTDNRKRRRPFPGEGYLWAAWHRIRGHRVERWGYSISHGGSRRSWYCLGAGLGCGTSWPRDPTQASDSPEKTT